RRRADAADLLALHADRLVPVALDSGNLEPLQLLDHLVGMRPATDDVTDAPDRVAADGGRIGEDGAQRREVGVNVPDDRDPHLAILCPGPVRRCRTGLALSLGSGQKYGRGRSTAQVRIRRRRAVAPQAVATPDKGLIA